VLERELEPVSQLHARLNELGEIVLADGVAKRGLRRQDHRLVVVLHLERRALGIAHDPEGDGVDVHRHRVARQA
jgi:hypothetical protein